ncbi:Permease of the drug/metabolite transporter (DMT) superfamily [Thauera aromatica K172]|uniref:Permease of the drug/metabolite transporter (DMT) superfamily n=2 Tax=Zoogloeaceae TaxID=2008794 RepID=A0A2R4BMD0_THAAR|nr:Permease of the drug/metabolite transporter (DMT) superfamily [Thauera aromatica K172]
MIPARRLDFIDEIHGCIMQAECGDPGSQSLFAPSAEGVWIGDGLFLVAALCWAIFGLLMRHWQIRPQMDIIGIASFSLVIYLPVYLFWLPSNIAHASWGEIGLQAMYQGIIAALLAAGMYSYANQKIGACQASMILVLVPAFSAIGGVLILDELLGITTALGIVVVSIGALLGALPTGSMARQKTIRKKNQAA